MALIRILWGFAYVTNDTRRLEFPRQSKIHEQERNRYIIVGKSYYCVFLNSVLVGCIEWRGPLVSGHLAREKERLQSTQGYECPCQRLTSQFRTETWQVRN